MKALDKFLQRWRINTAARCIAPKSRILDIGTSDGALFHQLPALRKGSMGIDLTLPHEQHIGEACLVRGRFPHNMPDVEPFDAITMLAVLEHFPEDQYEALSQGCARYLKPGGHLIITVPSPLVDRILDVLKFLRLLDGMCTEEHHGYQVGQTHEIFGSAFKRTKHSTFQLGLNNLFVFERVATAAVRTAERAPVPALDPCYQTT